MSAPKQLRLVADTVRAHRTAILLWAGVGAAAQVATAMMLAREFADTPGGGRALAPAVETAAEAFRFMRWPAERLDTLGGYLTYHNILLIPLLLGLYAAMQGVQAVRGAEAGGSLEELLATGWSRAAVVRDRALGFVCVLALIALGLGAGTAAGLAAGGEPDTLGALVSVGEAALCAFSFYGLGLLVAQLVRGARTATGLTVLAMTVVYVFTNLWDLSGPLAGARFLSPFFYFQQSRVLVPGHGFDPWATLALAVIPGLLLAAGAWAFARRDYASTLWPRRAGGGRARAGSVLRPWLTSLWSAALLRQRLGLLAWAGATAAFAALIVYLEPQVRQMWNETEYFKRWLQMTGTGSLTDQYLAFAGEVLAPVVGGYAATQVAAWISDLRQGRVELYLSTPVSWRRLVTERMLTLAAGVGIITGGAILGVVAMAAVVGVDLRPDGLTRLGGDSVLFGLAMGGLGAALAALLRGPLAPALLAVFLTGSYLLDLVAPVYEWPTWLSRLSVFDAFGRPYLEVPGLAGIGLLTVLALAGAGAAAWISARTPKVA